MYIKTQRLELKPITPAAFKALVDLLTDATVGKTYMVPEFPDRAAAEPLAQRLMALSEDPGRIVAGVFLEDELIGLFNETEVNGSTIEVGYALLPQYYNRGYATEMLTGAIETLFARGFCRVVAGAFEENPASLRVMEKSGMQRLARRETVTYRRKDHGCVYYAATRGIRVKITAIRKASYQDLMAQYENPIQHACDVEEGMRWFSDQGQKPQGFCDSAWESVAPFVAELARGGGYFYENWMKDPYSAMISCNDGFRPVSFYLEVVEG